MTATRNNLDLACENTEIERAHGHLKREVADALVPEGEGLSGVAFPHLGFEAEAKRRQRAGQGAQPGIAVFAQRPVQGLARHARFP